MDQNSALEVAEITHRSLNIGQQHLSYTIRNTELNTVAIYQVFIGTIAA